MGKCSEIHSKIKVPNLGKLGEFWYISIMSSMTTEQKKKLLKAKVAVAL